MSAWGRTGRVEIRGDVNDPRGLPNVYVDAEWVGWLYTPDDGHPKWGARSWCSAGRRDDLPSLDAAVAWVLRRAATDVWRAERPVVWRVYRRQSRVTWGAWNWLADSLTDPHEIGGTDVLHRSLLAWADREARAEYAREATP